MRIHERKLCYILFYTAVTHTNDRLRRTYLQNTHLRTKKINYIESDYDFITTFSRDRDFI